VSGKTVLVVDDERAIQRFLRASLEENGFAVIDASTGKSAIDLAVSRKPDVVLLDLTLPDLDGLVVLKRLREWSSAPVIVVSARGQESDKIAGLDLGADDYLIKPFGVEELLARIRVALRHAERAARDPEPVYEHGDLKIDLAARRVWLAKKEVRLSPLQYALLELIARMAERFFVLLLLRGVPANFGEPTDAAVQSVHPAHNAINPEPRPIFA